MTTTALDRHDPVTAGTAPVDLAGFDPACAHRHTVRCYWDLYRCGWRCPPASPAAPTGPPRG